MIKTILALICLRFWRQSSWSRLFGTPSRRRIYGEGHVTMPLAIPARDCLVTLTDIRGIRHTVEVRAESLFEAACLALQVLKTDDWMDAVGPATRLEVEVRPPAVKHVVTVQQLQRWADSTATGPEDRLRKHRLKAMLHS
jgi:hypothetical protein